VKLPIAGAPLSPSPPLSLYLSISHSPISPPPVHLLLLLPPPRPADEISRRRQSLVFMTRLYNRPTFDSVSIRRDTNVALYCRIKAPFTFPATMFWDLRRCRIWDLSEESVLMTNRTGYGGKRWGGGEGGERGKHVLARHGAQHRRRRKFRRRKFRRGGYTFSSQCRIWTLDADLREPRRGRKHLRVRDEENQ